MIDRLIFRTQRRLECIFRGQGPPSSPETQVFTRCILDSIPGNLFESPTETEHFMTQMRLFGSAALPVDNGRHVEGRDPQGMVIGDG